MTVAVDGALRFARYAFPPNSLGYCGPVDARALLEYAAADTIDGGLVELTQRFSGAWPYLEVIAGSVGRDPLDRAVVEAYWIGNSLLDVVHRPSFAASVEERFRARTGPAWDFLAPVVPSGGLPHHSFHVFCVYPWVGLLRGGRIDEPLHVLDRCRIRWADVLAIDGDSAIVEFLPLSWDGSKLGYGPPQTEAVRTHLDGASLVGSLSPGDVVACHWDWVCERLTRRDLANLQRHTARTVQLVNGSARPAPAALA